MKRTTQGLFISMIWLAWLAATQVATGQEVQIPGDSGGPPAAKPPEAADQPEPPRSPTDTAETFLEPVPEGDAPTLVDESVPWGEGVFGERLPGPCCAVCGGGNACPPDWYLQQDVRVLTRSRSRATLLTVESPATSFATFNVGFSLFQVTEDDPATPADEARFVVANQTPPSRFNPTTGEREPVAQNRMGTADLSPDIAAGYQATVGRYLGRDVKNRDQFLEFTFWGMNTWTEGRTVNGELRPLYDETVQYTTDEALAIQNGLDLPDIASYMGNLTSLFPVVTDADVANGLASADARALSDAFNDAEYHASLYLSRIDNFELNARLRPRSRAGRLVMRNDRWQRECEPGNYFSYLFGLRVMSIDERFSFFSRGRRLDANRVLNYEATGDLLVRTYNDLVGIQIGADYIHRQCKFMYGVRCKAGPYVNFADHITDVNTDTAGGLLSLHRHARHDGAALIGEVGFVGAYKIRPNFMVRASYDFMWATGLALAPEQLRFKSDAEARVNTNGHIYYHGLSLGAEWSW